MEFNAGDVVQLKSGGPQMTVSEIINDAYGKRMVVCVWFEKTEQKLGEFPPATLHKPDASPKTLRRPEGGGGGGNDWMR